METIDGKQEEAMLAAPEATAPKLAERLRSIRGVMDGVATKHCAAKQGQGPAPDLRMVQGCIKKVGEIYPELSVVDRVQANMIIGCGHEILGDPDQAFEPLRHVVEAPPGSIAVNDQLSAILIVLTMLRRRSSWPDVVRYCDRARDLAKGVWVDHTLPYMKGVALSNLGRPADSAASLEECIAMKPGFRQAYVEFDKVVTVLRDFARCRRMAQKLVDHGGYWVNCWQRPEHFLADPPIRSQPWYDSASFGFCRLLEESFELIRGEVDALDEAAESLWGKVGSSDRGNENSAHDSDLVTRGDWNEVVLLGDTERCAANRLRCPETTRLLRSISEVAECAELQLGESLFSRLAPGTALRAHCGPTNTRLTCHLALHAPEEGCEITCGAESRSWKEGRCLVFDDSYEHEVRHSGDAPRTVLLINFWHPDIPRERRAQLMQELHGNKSGERGDGTASTS